MFYTQASIEKVKEADIVTTIGKYCDLKKEGANFKSKSPFAEEKTPSFVVSPTKEMFKCFSTGIGGDGIKFVMQQERVEFIEAIKIIAGIHNIFLEEEKVTEEVKLQRKHTISLKKLADNVALKYAKNLHNLKENHWAKKHLHNLGYSQETIIDFQLGFAAKNNEITNGCIEKALLAKAIAIGVSSSKDNKSYDFFQERIIFPIQNKNKEVVAYGGRRQNGEAFEKYPKYLNSKTTEIFEKSNVLYGYPQAKQSISKSGFAIITEGYTDVITMHQKECTQTVATCGTALTPEHAKQLFKLCGHIILFRDGDAAGVKASIRDIDILLQHGFRISIISLPEGEDPDSWARGQIDMPKIVRETAEDALEWRFNTLKIEANKGPYEKAAAITKVCTTLFCIKNEIVKGDYIKKAATIFKEKQATLKLQLSELEKQATAERERKTKGETTSLHANGLPKGADRDQYLKDRFCEVGNQYHFTKGDGFFPGTNFKLTPLFHIKGKKENKRLCELINVYNQKALIDLESDSFVNFSDFKKQLIRIGVYQFLSGSTTLHFDLLGQKILKEFVTALELQNMGWNPKGFFAFSNGVYWNNKFQKVNKYGIMHLEGVDTDDEDEYNEKVEYYYSPAESVMHKKNQDGDDPYENDRKFIYKKAPITITQWMDEMLTVFQEKGRLGILFNFATLFRDLFLRNYDYFPLLGGFGEKDSGKSGFGKIIQNFFFFGLEPLELNQSTLVGFNRRLSRTTNTTVFLDEYTDRIDEKMFQAMKGAWNGLGREKGMATNDKRTIYDKVNSSIYYAGQYLPTRDDNSLATRTICMQFPSKNYTSEEKDAYNKLMNWTTQGLSSLVFEVLEHRQYFESNLPRIFSEVTRELKEALKDQEYQERIFGNYAVLLITHKILSDKITLPFNYKTIFTQCVEGIIENSEAVQDSNGLTEFWNIIEWMFERSFIKEGMQFKIEASPTVKYLGNKKEVITYNNLERKKILYLRLNSVHQDYLKEVTKREGVNPIGETTLRNYFKSRGYFIGLVKGKRFTNGVSSCYAFDYDKMINQNIVSLETPEAQQTIPGINQPTEKIKDESEPDDLPF